MKHKKWKIDPISLFSHELKTPLSSLRLGFSLLEKDFEKNKKLIRLMKEEVEAMIDFVTDNLDLRFIQEKSDLFQKKWELFDILLSQSCKKLKLIAEKDNVTFQIKKLNKEEDIELFIDPVWITRLLENLLSNALKFSPKKGQIFIEYGIKKGEFVCSVRDEGVGFSDKQKAFNLFYKGTAKSKKHLKNTGLGLSIAKAIVESHGGQISISSEKNQGAKLIFNLPQVRLLKKTA